MILFRGAVLSIGLVFLLGGIAPGAAQVVDRRDVSVRLVLVDVTALDGSGAFVEDLRGDEFQVLEDGRPVALQSAELVRPRVSGASVKADAGSPLFVVFDSINTIRRMLDRKRSEITGQLADFVRRGRRVMVMELAESGDMKVLQTPTEDPLLIGQAVERAAGSIWVEKAADALSVPSILTTQALETGEPVGANKFEKAGRDIYELATRQRFERTVNGLLAAFQVIQTYPGRKPVLFISSGLPNISFGSFFSGKAGASSDTIGTQSQVEAAKIRDPFAVLRKKGVKFGEDILNSLAVFANSHNISLYAIDPDNYLRYLLGDMAYDNFPRALPGIGARSVALRFQFDQIEEIRKAELSKLDSLARDTSGLAFLGGDRFEQFEVALERDLTRCYELSYTPPRKNPDGRYHKISVKTTRPGITLRSRAGYLDYDEDQKASIALAAAAVQPALFNDVSFDARIVPFIQGRNRYILWVLMAIPTDRLLGEGRDLDRPCRLRFQITVDEEGASAGGSVSDVKLPIVLSPAFLARISRASFFGLSLRSGETALVKDAYRVAVALYDMDYGTIGTAVSAMNVMPPAQDAAAVANVVPGNLSRDDELLKPGLSISETDGTLVMPGYRFHPMAVARWERRKSAAVVIQVRLPIRPQSPKPSFVLRGAEGRTAEVAAERVQDAWDGAARAWTGVYRLTIGEFPPGPAELVVTWPVATGVAPTQTVSLVIL